MPRQRQVKSSYASVVFLSNRAGFAVKLTSERSLTLVSASGIKSGEI
jgi:hypothetical protein